MNRLNNIAVILMLGLIMTGCGQNPSKKSSGEKQQSEAKTQKKTKTNLKHKPIDADTIDIALNNGKPWQVDSITRVHMLKINNLIRKNGRNLRQLNTGHFEKLKADIEHALRKIENHNQLKGQAKKEFQTLLRLIKRETKALGKGDKKKGQVALFNLSELMKIYRQHFK